MWGRTTEPRGENTVKLPRERVLFLQKLYVPQMSPLGLVDARPDVGFDQTWGHDAADKAEFCLIGWGKSSAHLMPTNDEVRSPLKPPHQGRSRDS